MKNSLIAVCTAGLLAATLNVQAATAQKAPAKKSTAAAKAAPKKTVAKKPVKKAAPVKRVDKVKQALRVNPVTGASAPAAPIPPGPGQVFPAQALPVFVGDMQCELGAHVNVMQDATDPYLYHVNAGKGISYRMRQEPTTTGVVRLEDKQAGATWLQLGNKSMLMDQKRGERVADGCQNPQQVARDQELKKQPVDLLK